MLQSKVKQESIHCNSCLIHFNAFCLLAHRITRLYGHSVDVDRIGQYVMKCGLWVHAEGLSLPTPTTNNQMIQMFK